MATTSIYLNFSRETEKAFNFYKSVFGGEFNGSGISRMGDVPAPAGAPALSAADKQLVMHVELALPGGVMLMGTDAPESMGFNIQAGNNVYICLDPDSRDETRRIFHELAVGGSVTMELQDMFWGNYYGSCTDKFGVQWMFNCTANK